MDPTHLKITKHKKTKKAIIPPSVMINQPNLRQILLDKLMKHRKTQKKKDPDILSNNFDDQCMFPDGKDPEPHHFEIPFSESTISVLKPASVPVYSTVQTDKPYGVLKNGIKPTYKTWNKTQKHNITNPNSHISTCFPIEVRPFETKQKDIPMEIPMDIPIELKSLEPISQAQVQHQDTCELKLETMETKIPVKIGKSKKNKTVHVLIPCNETRKHRTEEHDSFRKTNLSTVKNYLKSRKLIKVGSTAPTNLIRQIYENAKSYGDVVNENKQNLLYNFEKDSDSQ